jgi:uncharacterized protein (TIGR02246 family)
VLASVLGYLAAILISAVPSGEAAPQGPEALVAGFANALNSHNASAFAQLFTDDADLVTTYDVRADGRSKIVADLEEIHQGGWAKDTTVAVSKTVVRLLRPDVAVIHFNADLKWPGNEPPVGRTMLFVAVKGAGRWKISAGQVAKPNCPEHD